MAVVAVNFRFIIMSLILLLPVLFITASDTDAHALEDEEDFFSIEMEELMHGVPDGGDVATKGRKLIQNKVVVNAENEAEKSSDKKGNKISHFDSKRTMKAPAGFVAFSADYHPPRHHPPKNN
ncbi:protein GOLVEN 7 [Mercurialis annua]|uniref:protein GOLVEN 7 n=1 Tax=Mercurialis annua TaxID=3986 RepID=UPI0021608198|nr:protein GOLVEN 7 [Mercurialis annua]